MSATRSGRCMWRRARPRTELSSSASPTAAMAGWSFPTDRPKMSRVEPESPSLVVMDMGDLQSAFVSPCQQFHGMENARCAAARAKVRGDLCHAADVAHHDIISAGGGDVRGFLPSKAGGDFGLI